jgi:hypothetical protein
MRILLIFSLIFLQTIPPSWADTPLPPEFRLPKTNSDLELLSLLQAIQEEVPNLFENGWKYGFDPHELLADQARLLAELEKKS